jgi:cobalamin synthase
MTWQWREISLAPGEWRAGLGLVFTVALAAYLLSSGEAVWAADSADDLRRLGRSVLILLAAWGVASTVLASWSTGQVQKDERDRLIEARSEQWGRGALVLAVAGVAVLFGLTPPERLVWATPLVVAHLLVFTLLWGSVVEYAASVVQYTRDRWA